MCLAANVESPKREQETDPAVSALFFKKVGADARGRMTFHRAWGFSKVNQTFEYPDREQGQGVEVGQSRRVALPLCLQSGNGPQAVDEWMDSWTRPSHGSPALLLASIEMISSRLCRACQR